MTGQDRIGDIRATIEYVRYLSDMVEISRRSYGRMNDRALELELQRDNTLSSLSAAEPDLVRCLQKEIRARDDYCRAYANANRYLKRIRKELEG